MTARRSSWSKAMSTSSPWSPSGFPGCGRAARHGADRKPARAALAHGRRADPLLRRRPRRTEGRVSRRRPRAAASQARKESALRAAAGRAGPRRSRALRRTRRDRGRDRRRARPRRDDLVARDRGRQFCHARAPRRAGSAHRRTDATPSATRSCGATIARISPSACSARSRPRAAAAITCAAILPAAAGPNHPAVLPPATGGPAGRFAARGAGRGRPARARSRALPGGERATCEQARSCAASARRSPAARR